MQIVAGNPLQKFGQIVFPAPHWFDDNAAGLLAYVHRLVQMQLRRLQGSGGNSHCSAIAPFLDHSPHIVLPSSYLHCIYILPWIQAWVNICEARVRSAYRWKGKVETAREVLLLIKTTRRTFPAVARRIRALHSYEVPEIIALPIVTGSRDYLAWLESSVARPRRAKKAARPG
jgi:periplasmic divalent cation tolerance protein